MQCVLWQYNMLTKGTEGAICQLLDALKGAGANGYI